MGVRAPLVVTADGEVPFTRPVAGIDPTADEHLATKAYVDSSGGGGGVTVHEDLTGLSADDHPQYVLADGTRAFTGVVVGVDPTLSTHLATKGYTDYADGVVSSTVLAAAVAAFQPLNAVLTNVSTFTTSVSGNVPYFVNTIGGLSSFASTSFGRGLLNSADASAVRTAIGAVIGTDVQAYDADLAAIAGLTSAADRGIYFTGSGTASLFTLTSAARTVLDDTTVSAMVDTLGGAASTGTGGLARENGPTLVAPKLGTPHSGDLANCTGLPTSGLAASAVTYAKMQNVSATDKVLGRSTAGAGVVEEIACTAAGRALLDDADATAQRATLGLVLGTDVGLPQNERGSEQFWDCDGAVGEWTSTSSGAGAVATVFTTDHIGGSLHVCGEWGLGTGTTSTGYAAFYRQPFVGFGDGTTYEFEARITNGALSTSGEEFQLTIGFGDAFNATGQPVDGAYFIYRRDVDGDFWVAVTRSNSTETKTVTATAPAGYSAMTIFKVEVNSAGTSVSFSINGSAVATHTTNIPTGSSRLTGMGIKLEKQNGTTARFAYVDWFRLKKTRTAAR